MDPKPTYAELVEKNKELEKSLFNTRDALAKIEVDEKVFRLMLESISDTVILTDDLGVMQYVCPNTSGIFIISQDEIYRLKTIEKLLCGRVPEVERLNEKREIQGIEWQFRDVGGHEKHLLINLKAVNLAGGTVLYSIRDITDYIESKKALEHFESRYSHIFDSLIDVYVETDRDGVITEISPSCEIHAGYRREKIIGTPSANYYADKELSEEFLKILASEGVVDDFEVDFIHKNGKILPFSITAKTIRDAQGNFIKAVCMMKNIKDRKKAEKNHYLNVQKYRSMVENVGIGVALINPDMEVVELNRQMREWFPEIDTGSRPICYEVFNDPPRSGVCDYCPTHQTLKDGKVHEAITSTPKGGETLNFRIVSSPIVNEAGEVTAAIEMVEDITEKNKLEAQIRQNQRLEAIGNLAGGIAHDFNNILTSIIGFAELAIDETESGSAIEDDLQEIYAAGKRARDLVKQILTFARQSEKDLRPMQINVLIQEVLKFLRASIPTTIEIKQSIQSESPVMANPTQIHQLLMNLCTNAADAMEDKGGILEISLRDVQQMDPCLFDRSFSLSGTYVELKVADTGVGISPAVIESIYEPYFTTKAPGEGTGLGLATVHGIVKRTGGEIRVDSTPGKGSTFFVYLPVTQKPGAQFLYVSQDLPTGSEKILFVDDEAPIAKLGHQMLESLGYSVTTRTSSVEALALFENDPNQFDLVITDMTMPNMAGDQLAAELIKLRQNIPILLCSGYSKKMDPVAASEIGVRAFAYKPIVKSDLAKTVRGVLDAAKNENSPEASAEDG